MKTLLFLLVLACVAIESRATPPKIVPLPDVLNRFEQEFLTKCDGLATNIRSRMALPLSEQDISHLDIFTGYLQNIRQDDIPGLKRALSDATGKLTPYWCDRLRTDIAGLRRQLDELLILCLAEKRLVIDTLLRKQIQDFWEDERGFSFWFGHEASKSFAR
jgi:hypothetical protein